MKGIIVHRKNNPRPVIMITIKNIYAYIARMSCNDESSSRYFGDSLKFTNCILDSGATYHMTLQVSNFIPCSL